MKERLVVGGMSCSACSLGIEKTVKALNGVLNVNVSLMSKEMSVEFDESIINIEKIIESVVKLGYTAKKFGEKEAVSDAQKLKRRFVCSLIVLIPLMYLCFGKMLSFPVPTDKVSYALQFVLALIVMIINKKFFFSGTRAVLNRMPNMDTLVALGSASAFIFSVVLTVVTFLGNEVGHVFYDSSAMVLTLVTLGKWIEEVSKKKTGDAIEKLNNLLPKTTTILFDGKEKVVLTSLVKVGDKVVLKAGDYVTVDGKILEGTSGIDSSAITGESIPKEVTVGDLVSSGSIVKEGYLLVEATSVGEDTLFSRIVQTVKKAGESKAPAQKFADKVAGIFVPIVLGLALLTFFIWTITTGDLYNSFNFGISVLVISCPCALGLATPVAVVSATGVSAKHGILFKNAETLENTRKINLIVLDKTATLTVGKPKVTNYLNVTGEADETLFPLISALEEKSSHPLAECIKEHCGESDKKVTDYEYFIGKGACGKIDGVSYYIGNEEILPNGIAIPDLPRDFEDKTIIYFADEIQLISVFALADTLKEDAKQTINELNKRNVKTVMLTGDNYGVAGRVAKEVGISDFKAQVLPQDKYLIVEEYKKDGYYTAMVGDGINDSPALKSSMVGIAMGNGTDIAIDSADVVIANGNLSALIKSIDISKKSFKIIKENLFWAFIYNLLAIPVAGGALFSLGITLTPAIASALMCLSSVFVVTNATRICKEKNHKQKTIKPSFEYKVLIGGMHCNHCVTKVNDSLKQINGVLSIDVSLKTNSATLQTDKSVTEQKIYKAIEQVGFSVQKVAKKQL